MNLRLKTIRRTVLIVLILSFVLLGIWSVLIEPNRLVVHSEELKLPSWPAEFDGLRVAALGDIHAGSPFIDESKLRKIVSVTNALQPDLIVLLGDYMIRDQFYRRHTDPEITANALKDLKAPLGVYAVLGNHDWWFDGNRVRQALENAGIKVLDNEAVELRRTKKSFWLVGLADLWTGPQNISGTLSLVPNGAPSIVITHNPDAFVQLPQTVSLTIAAHTHGGQVNLPLLGRLVVPSNYGQRYAAGHIEENGKHMFVTTGIGTSILPLRFRVPPEIAVLTIRSR